MYMNDFKNCEFWGPNYTNIIYIVLSQLFIGRKTAHKVIFLKIQCEVTVLFNET